MSVRTVSAQCAVCEKKRPCTVVTVRGKNEMVCIPCYRELRGLPPRGPDEKLPVPRV